MGVQLRVGLRAPFYFRTTGRAVRGHSLLAGVCRRFLCFVSFSPLEKEMKCRHAQWLIVISNKIQHITRSDLSRTPLQHITREGESRTTRHQPHPALSKTTTQNPKRQRPPSALPPPQ